MKVEVMPGDEKICPFLGVLFKDVPGYAEGYGCPLCKGLSYHVSVTPADVVTASEETLIAALHRVLFRQREIDAATLRVVTEEYKAVARLMKEDEEQDEQREVRTK